MMASLAQTLSHLSAKLVSKLERSGAQQMGALIAIEGLGAVADVNGARALAPNSTQKLFTAGAALLHLGADYRFRTELRATGPVDGEGTLQGDLVLFASGDPTLSSLQVRELSSAVARSGIRRVRGTLVIDDTRHDMVRNVAGWKPYYVPSFSGPLSAMALDGNRWRRDPEFLSNPARLNADRIAGALAKAGVRLESRPRIGHRTHGGETVWMHNSAPIAQLLCNMLKKSDNFIAEQVLKEMGAGATPGTTSSGLAVIDRVTEGLGVPRAPCSTDGSGLSPLNLDTPLRQVMWLQAIDRTEFGPSFRKCLPSSGNDENLRYRLEKDQIPGRVFAKTGSRPYGGYANLAGFCDLGGRMLWFSFMLSGAASVPQGRRCINRALTVALRFGAVLGPA